MLVEQAEDSRRELAQVHGIELGKGDPRHQVAAEHRLGIETRHRGELLSRLELEERGDDAGGPDVDGEAEFHQRGVAALDGENAPAEGRDRDQATVVAEGGGQPEQDARPDVGGLAADGGEELLEVGRLMVLVVRHRHLDDLLGHTGVHHDAGRARHARAGAEDLKGLLVERGCELDGERLLETTLTGQPIALADEIVAELHLIGERRRWDGAGDELDPTRRASAAAATRGGDVDPTVVRGLQQGGAGGR